MVKFSTPATDMSSLNISESKTQGTNVDLSDMIRISTTSLLDSKAIERVRDGRKGTELMLPIMVVGLMVGLLMLVFFLGLTKSAKKKKKLAVSSESSVSSSTQGSPKRGSHPPYVKGFCLACDGQICKTEGTFAKHCKAKHRRNKFRCKTCWNVFETAADLEKHAKYQNVV